MANPLPPTSDYLGPWPIDRHITIEDDGPQAVTFDLGNESLSLAGVESVQRVHAALTEWLAHYHGIEFTVFDGGGANG